MPQKLTNLPGPLPFLVKGGNKEEIYKEGLEFYGIFFPFSVKKVIREVLWYNPWRKDSSS